VLLVNTPLSPADVRASRQIQDRRLFTVDATKIAVEELGRAITNTTMLGAMVKLTGVIKSESIEGPLTHRFGRIAPRNLKSFQRAFNEVRE
jgi:pyruvate ferredoxin oxidoreductase gamma subunit